MTYCTQQDLIDRVGAVRLAQRTDRVNKPASVVDPVVVDKHIGDAVSMIDGYLAKRHKLPLGNVPGVLTKIAVDLSWYFILGDAVQKDSAEAASYKAARDWLRDVSLGHVVLEIDGVEAEAAGGGQVRTSAPDRVFTRSSLDGF